MEKQVLLRDGREWEFPPGEPAAWEFLARPDWGVDPNEKQIAFDLFDHERAHIQLVYSWVQKHEEEVGTDILLTKEKVFWFLVALD